MGVGVGQTGQVGVGVGVGQTLQVGVGVGQVGVGQTGHVGVGHAGQVGRHPEIRAPEKRGAKKSTKSGRTQIHENPFFMTRLTPLLPFSIVYHFTAR